MDEGTSEMTPEEFSHRWPWCCWLARTALACTWLVACTRLVLRVRWDGLHSRQRSIGPRGGTRDASRTTPARRPPHATVRSSSDRLRSRGQAMATVLLLLQLLRAAQHRLACLAL
jgi:hypothetical protein